MKTGEVLVAIGSTEKLGTGVNVQHKLAALHHLDVPWKPAGLEQRDGRGLRQGNMNDPTKEAKDQNIDIYRYVAEGSLDQTFWQIVGAKARFIKQVIGGQDKGLRVAKDDDTEELSADRFKALASGDPRIMEKVNLEDDLSNLKAAAVRHDREQNKLKRKVAEGQQRIPQLKERAEKMGSDAAHLESKPDFEMHIGGRTHDERKPAAEALVEAANAVDAEENAKDSWQKENTPAPIGEYRGFTVLRGRGRSISEGALWLQGPSGQMYPTGGSLQSLEAVARNLSKKKVEAERDHADAIADVARVGAGIGKPFPKAAELAAKHERVQQLEGELRAETAEKED